MSVTSPTSPTSPVQHGAAGSQVFSRPFALRAVGVLAISAAAAAGASALFAAGGTRQPPPAAVHAPVPEVQAVSAAQAASFGVLRRPVRASDAFDTIHGGAGPLGANPQLARSLREPGGGLSAGLVSVVPANGGVCLRVPFTSAAGAQWFCQSLALAREGRLAMALRPIGRLRASRQLLVGLVPDGVRTVTVTTPAGRRVVAVRSNVYDVQLFAPRRITIDVPGAGVRSLPAP